MKRDRPRIVHIISGLETGGAERALLNLLRGGLQEKYDSLVVSLGDEGTMGGQIQETGADVQTLRIGKGRHFLTAVPRLLKLVKGHRPDLMQGWMYHGNLAATVARKLSSVSPPLLWNIRQTLYDLRKEKRLTQYVIRSNRWLSSSPDVIIYNSAVSREQHETFGVSADNGAVIPNGIDLSRHVYSASTRAQKRAELGLPEQCQVIGHFARYHPMKDHKLFVNAAIRIARSQDECHFVLVGRDVSWQREDLVSSIPDGLRERFQFLGERNDISQLMSALDVLCLSSRWGEGFPNVLGEAMATGIPCVTTDVGDSAVVIGDVGTVVPPGDEEALVDGLNRMLGLSDEQRAALSERARNRIVENFSLDANVQRYVETYDRLIASVGVD